MLTGGVPRVIAHSDPWGDIHPQVLVMNDKFAIDFNTSRADQQETFTAARPVQRVIYTADGKLFAPRHPLHRDRSYSEMGPAGIYGTSARLGDSTIIFQGRQSGQPDYLLKSADGKFTRVRLPWPDHVSLSLLENVLVVPEGIAMTGKEGKDHSPNDPLRFYWFAHESTGKPALLTIGPTACIYQFPVASNLAFAGGRFWLAYMRPTKEDLKLALWSWKPGDKAARVEDLDSPADWNSDLSLAAIGDRLCLAYHCVNSREYPGNAEIVTVFRKAESSMHPPGS